MARTLSALAVLAIVLALIQPGCAEETAPVWAYPAAPRDYVPPKDDGTKRHVPGSDAGFTLSEIRDLFFALDWFPGTHPPMPQVVAMGRKPDFRPCGVCYRPEGVGGPENASLAARQPRLGRGPRHRRGGRTDPGLCGMSWRRAARPGEHPAARRALTDDDFGQLYEFKTGI
jgi:hypothetical protein